MSCLTITMFVSVIVWCLNLQEARPTFFWGDLISSSTGFWALTWLARRFGRFLLCGFMTLREPSQMILFWSRWVSLALDALAKWQRVSLVLATLACVSSNRMKLQLITATCAGFLVMPAYRIRLRSAVSWCSWKAPGEGQGEVDGFGFVVSSSGVKAFSLDVHGRMLLQMDLVCLMCPLTKHSFFHWSRMA